MKRIVLRKSIKRTSTTAVLMIFLSFSLFSQSIQERSFDARWLVFSNITFFANTQAELYLEGDSIINLSFNKSDALNHYMGERWHYRMNTQLQVVDSFQVWSRQYAYRPSNWNELAHSVKMIKNGATGDLYHYELLIPNDSTMEIALFDTQSDLRKGNPLVRDTIIGIREIVPYLYDTTLTLLIAPDQNNPYLKAKAFSTSSSLLIKEDTNLVDTNMVFGSFNLNDIQKVIPNPSNPDEVFLFRNGSLYNLGLFNWRTQKFIDIYVPFTVDISDSLLIRHKIVYNEYFDVHISDTNSFLFIGKHEMDDLFTTTVYSLNIALHEISSQDSLLSVRDYGNPASPDSNDVIGMIYRKYGDTEYILGRKGNRRWGFYIPNDTMKLVLYTIDSTGVDSLYFHGYGNHMPLDMQRTYNGDIYICSVLSTNKTNHQVYVSLTKIPASLLVTIKEQEFGRKLYLYPNPTQDVLRSSEFEEAREIRIYDINGRLQKTFRGQQNEIPVQELVSGSYIIQVEKEGGASSGIFIKQ
jgi:hypothetical protein